MCDDDVVKELGRRDEFIFEEAPERTLKGQTASMLDRLHIAS